MDAESKKVVNKYLGDISKKLPAAFITKWLYKRKLKRDVIARFGQTDGITYENLCEALGTPEEICGGFLNLGEYKKLRAEAVILTVALAVLAALLVLFIVILMAQLTYKPGTIYESIPH